MCHKRGEKLTDLRNFPAKLTENGQFCDWMNSRFWGKMKTEQENNRHRVTKLGKVVDYMINATAHLVGDNEQVDILLGTKLTKKGVDDTMAKTAKVTEINEETVGEIVANEEVKIEDKAEVTGNEMGEAIETTPEATGDVTIEELSSTVPHETLEELKGFIKDIDTDTLEFIATTLSADWSRHENAPINRMRVAMSIQRYFFPELFSPKEESGKKKKAKYADLSNEKLFEMAKAGKVAVETTGHAPIDRMRVIVGLKAAGLLPK